MYYLKFHKYKNKNNQIGSAIVTTLIQQNTPLYNVLITNRDNSSHDILGNNLSFFLDLNVAIDYAEKYMIDSTQPQNKKIYINQYALKANIITDVEDGKVITNISKNDVNYITNVKEWGSFISSPNRVYNNIYDNYDNTYYLNNYLYYPEGYIYYPNVYSPYAYYPNSFLNYIPAYTFSPSNLTNLLSTF